MPCWCLVTFSFYHRIFKSVNWLARRRFWDGEQIFFITSSCFSFLSLWQLLGRSVLANGVLANPQQPMARSAQLMWSSPQVLLSSCYGKKHLAFDFFWRQHLLIFGTRLGTSMSHKSVFLWIGFLAGFVHLGMCLVCSSAAVDLSFNVG